MDELRVSDAVGLGCGIDAHDPERAELALLLFASAVSELHAALDGFLGCLVELGFGEEVAAGALQDFLAAVGAFGSTFDAWHASFLLVCCGSAAGGGKNLFTRSAYPIHSQLALREPCGPERSGVGNHAGNLLVVGVGNQAAMGQLALGFRLLRREDVPHFGLAAEKFARAGLFEALGCAPVCLEFGHGSPGT